MDSQQEKHPENVIRVMVVDDSPTLRQLVRSVLESDPQLVVVGEAENGVEAIALCQELEPDLITMDIQMPKMNGFRAIERIMSDSPRPIVVLTSTWSDQMLEVGRRGLEVGAVLVCRKPKGLPEADRQATELISQVKAMAGVKVVGRRWPRQTQGTMAVRCGSRQVDGPREADVFPRRFTVIAIGASTGGPPALQSILLALPVPFPLPVVIVQHISEGFVSGLARWLTRTTDHQVVVASGMERLVPGMVYLAPDARHLVFRRRGILSLSGAEAVDGHRPSVTALLRSTAEHYGPLAVGVLLTGMGQDGARGLAEMRQSGAHTIAQDEASSVVFGMPRVAIERDAVKEVLPLDQIGKRLASLVLASERAVHSTGEGR